MNPSNGKRIPSRRMPKYVPSPMGWFGWFMLCGLLSAAIYLLFDDPYKFIWMIVFVCVIACAGSFALRKSESRLRALAGQRKGQTICEFAREFDTRSVDTWVIRAVYEQVQSQLTHVHPEFPVRADDRLKEDLYLDDDDLDLDLAEEIAQRTGRTFDALESNPYWGKVKTVRDLVYCFQYQPKKNVPVQS